LQPSQIQDLADMMGNLLKAAEGNELRFRLRIEFGGEEIPSSNLTDQLNEILEQISKDLILK